MKLTVKIFIGMFIFSLPMVFLQGERDYQIRADKDFVGWKTALQAKENVSFELYPQLNHLFISGEGPSTPQEYQIAGHVSQEVIDDIVTWLGQKDQNSQMPLQNGLTLTVRRWFNVGLMNRAYGKLQLSVSGPADLESVTFFLDGQVLQTISAPPFQSFFETSQYASGWHELSATGKTAGGQFLTSNTARYEFLTATEANRILWMVFGVVILLLLSAFFARSGLLGRKGKKSRKLPVEELRLVEAREVELIKTQKETPPDVDEKKLRRWIDQSRYDKS